jgi:hypothetical protein
MMCGKLGFSLDDFWKLTPGETAELIDEWAKLEELQSQAQATRTAYATVMMQNGKMPEWESGQKEKDRPVNNDMGFAGL